MILTVIYGEPARFNAIKRRLGGITHKALTDALLRLERQWRRAIRLVALERELTLTGAFVDAPTAVIADHMIVLVVASRTTQAITGATSYGVGVAGNTRQFGGSLGIALGSNNIGVVGSTTFYANTPIRVAAVGCDFTGGKVRVVL